ncbi:PEP-CTERM sorting domain-containing protein [Massilia pseudoviolaceinigra]|uniref:PEP-CTERM sorting domain-containing protein n=1 Tax=Massilia pseudoviolaceinigra TaxID=3057165 RepID=UPI002796585B|nr:PEP-CTERM sorting domain-containing protein [Massilia sp. CCM 9206]MDQ1924163.1 PEP-CTERM sorting domain-containing protein [Massilia sp. CCM 9206]
MYAHLNKFSLCALAALAAAWAPAQAASSTVAASIDHFQYQLVDLDLADGISPSIIFANERWSSETYGAGQQQSLAAPGTTSIVTEFGTSGTTLSHSTLSSTASVNFPVPADGVKHLYWNRNSHSASFTLSPNTQLIFTGVARLSEQLVQKFDYSAGRIKMQGTLGDEADLMSTFEKSYLTNDGAATINLYGMLISDAQARQGQFSLETAASLSAPIAPIPSVPEPSSYAMLLAGTCLVGAVARRRRRAVARQAA